jgi:Domain of unknown function (DUF4336)
MLTTIAPDLWHLAASPLALPAGLRLPLAATVIRLPDRSLVIYSPVALDDASAAAIGAEGEVAHIVVPSLLHHMYAAAAAARFPRAIVHGVPGLTGKQPGLTITRELGSGGTDPAWGDVLDVVLVGGAPKVNEAVLFHRPSGTLVCADLLFNITRHETVMTRVILGMMGVGGKQLAQSRAWTFGVRDRGATRASIDRVLAWPIRRVAPTHGAAVEITAAELAPKLSRAYGGLARSAT